MQFARPFLIIPKFIEQPTWGGQYIVNNKQWVSRRILALLCIGQSYELYGKSKLSLNITDSDKEQFEPEICYSSGKKHELSTPSVELQTIIQKNPDEMLGPYVAKKYQTMPLLIKFTQAKGNSFQIHIKHDAKSSLWKAKPESWYFFEKGKITLGIRKDSDLNAYQKACRKIEEKMQTLSDEISHMKKSLEEAKKEAQVFIKHLNPWQFVNQNIVNPDTIVDLSSGGIHHSWEEDSQLLPQGNIVYEVQQDVNDAESTIRCFDQGKFKDDGSIRDIHIQDYFSYIDRSDRNNDLSSLIKKKTDRMIFNTPYYCTEELSVSGNRTFDTDNSFIHLFVRKGALAVEAKNGSIRLTEGHSGFIPWGVHKHTLHPQSVQTVVLKTYIK